MLMLPLLGCVEHTRCRPSLAGGCTGQLFVAREALV
jgi:hypothetical protein